MEQTDESTVWQEEMINLSLHSPVRVTSPSDEMTLSDKEAEVVLSPSYAGGGAEPLAVYAARKRLIAETHMTEEERLAYVAKQAAKARVSSYFAEVKYLSKGVFGMVFSGIPRYIMPLSFDDSHIMPLSFDDAPQPVLEHRDRELPRSMLEEHQQQQTQRLAIKCQEVVSEDGIPGVLLRELDILTRLKHPCVVSALQVYQYSNALDFSLPLFRTDLHRFVKSRSTAEQHRLDILEPVVLKLLDALCCLHECGIYHCDIKSSNILISFSKSVVATQLDGSKEEEERAKSKEKIVLEKIAFCDFGLSSLKNLDGTLKTLELCSEHCRPPELLRHPSRGLADISSAFEKVDVWALGCVFAELVIGKMPFFENIPNVGTLGEILMQSETPLSLAESVVTHKTVEYVQKLRQNNVRSFKLWHNLTLLAPRWTPLFRRMLCIDPEKRITAREAWSMAKSIVEQTRHCSEDSFEKTSPSAADDDGVSDFDSVSSALSVTNATTPAPAATSPNSADSSASHPSRWSYVVRQNYVFETYLKSSLLPATKPASSMTGAGTTTIAGDLTFSNGPRAATSTGVEHRSLLLSTELVATMSLMILDIAKKSVECLRLAQSLFIRMCNQSAAWHEDPQILLCNSAESTHASGQGGHDNCNGCSSSSSTLIRSSTSSVTSRARERKLLAMACSYVAIKYKYYRSPPLAELVSGKEDIKRVLQLESALLVQLCFKIG